MKAIFCPFQHICTYIELILIGYMRSQLSILSTLVSSRPPLGQEIVLYSPAENVQQKNKTGMSQAVVKRLVIRCALVDKSVTHTRTIMF